MKRTGAWAVVVGWLALVACCARAQPAKRYNVLQKFAYLTVIFDY